MHNRPDGRIGERHGIARLDVDLLTGNDLVAHGYALRRQNVVLGSIFITQQRDEGRPVRIIFDPLNGCLHVDFRSLEVDHTIEPLMSAATPARGDTAGIVAAAFLGQPLCQALDRLALPKMAAVDQNKASQTGRDGFECFQCHGITLA